jgi:hypothetical protein
MQENAQAQQRALASVRQVAGLPAPTQTYQPAALPSGAANAYTAQEAAPWEADETLDIGSLANPAAAAAVAQPVAAAVAHPAATVEVAAAVAAVATQVVQPAAVAQPAVATPAPAAVAQPAVAAAPAAAAGTGDPELDALLAGL